MIDLEKQAADIMPQVYFVTRYSMETIKNTFRKGDTAELESQLLDILTAAQLDESVLRQFLGLYKRRYLITPSENQSRTPNSAQISQDGPTKRRARQSAAEPQIGDELTERLLPKIFDDVSRKAWRNMNGNIDTTIAIEFLEQAFGEEDMDDQDLD